MSAGWLQATAHAEGRDLAVAPAACPLADLDRRPSVAALTCLEYHDYASHVSQCPHLLTLTNWDAAYERVQFADLQLRAQTSGLRQMRCAVICLAAKVPAKPGCWS